MKPTTINGVKIYSREISQLPGGRGYIYKTSAGEFTHRALAEKLGYSKSGLTIKLKAKATGKPGQGFGKWEGLSDKPREKQLPVVERGLLLEEKYFNDC